MSRAPADLARAFAANGPGKLADAAREFLRARKDDSLGRLPQSFLGPAGADAWACFWAAARRVDDALDRGMAVVSAGTAWRRFLETDEEAARFLDRFLQDLVSAVRDELTSERFEPAWRALLGRHAATRPRPLGRALAEDAEAAGLPMLVLFHFCGSALSLTDLLPLARLAGLSVQLGDDLRDLREDSDAGRWTFSQEELSEAGVPATLGGVRIEADRLAPTRRAMSAWFLREAFEELDALPVMAKRLLVPPLAFWWTALATDQVRPNAGHLRFENRAITSPPAAALSDRSSGVPVAILATMRRVARTLRVENRAWPLF